MDFGAYGRGLRYNRRVLDALERGDPGAERSARIYGYICFISVLFPIVVMAVPMSFFPLADAKDYYDPAADISELWGISSLVTWIMFVSFGVPAMRMRPGRIVETVVVVLTALYLWPMLVLGILGLVAPDVVFGPPNEFGHDWSHWRWLNLVFTLLSLLAWFRLVAYFRANRNPITPVTEGGALPVEPGPSEHPDRTDRLRPARESDPKTAMISVRTDLLTARDLARQGFLVTRAEADDHVLAHFEASRGGSTWEIQFGGVDAGGIAGELFDARADPDTVEEEERREEILDLGDAAVYSGCEVTVRTDSVVYWVSVFPSELDADPDHDVARPLTEQLARTVLARVADAPPLPRYTRDDHEEDREELRQWDKAMEAGERVLRLADLERLELDRGSLTPEDAAERQELERRQGEYERENPLPEPFLSELTDASWIGSRRKTKKVLRRYWDKLVPGHEDLGKDLVERYSRRGSGRHTHIDLAVALHSLDAAEGTTRAARLAAWFHVACVDDAGTPDFRASADLARRYLTRAGEPSETAVLVARMIEAMADPDALLEHDELGAAYLPCLGLEEVGESEEGARAGKV